VSSAHFPGILLACCILTLSACRSLPLGPTVPSGYRVVLPAASQMQRRQPLPLTVLVTDASGAPVDDVSVHFRIPDTWQTLAEVDPPVVTTQHGRATTTLHARAAGQMEVEITVENLVATVHITVLGETPRF
jgi:hypothetical protein